MTTEIYKKDGKVYRKFVDTTEIIDDIEVESRLRDVQEEIDTKQKDIDELLQEKEQLIAFK